jgi:ubiquinone/menaquinone biosynthesis C-methylase UbiE
MGCPGKKSHGLVGSFGKHSGIISHEKMKKFVPPTEVADSTYDPVADLYDKVFEDIKVRKDEWKWLTNHLPPAGFSMLDIGSGNGSMLRELSPQLDRGNGVDLSTRMVEIASEKSTPFTNLSFQKIEGPILPFEDNSFDVVTSFLSFRYLDWDPIMKEIVRVLRPGGKFLMIDMVTAPVKIREFPNLIRSKAKQILQHRFNPAWKEPLLLLSKDPRWAQMLALNPIRSDHEMRWYLESRFKDRRVEMLNVGWQNRVLAFDSGPIFDDYIPPQSYP